MNIITKFVIALSVLVGIVICESTTPQIPGHVVRVIFYEHADGKGESHKVYMDLTTCYNVPHEWNERFSSVNTENVCINIFEHGDCTGKSHRVAPGTICHKNFGECDLNDQVTSVNLCK